MINAQSVVSAANSVTGPIMVLLLLVMSAVFMAISLFAYPAHMYSKGKPERAIRVVVYSFVWLFVIFILFLISLAVGVGSTSGIN